MASAIFEVRLTVPAAVAWDAVRDFAAVHERLAVGFVTHAAMDADGKARTVTFANGMVVRERLVSIDDDRRRLVYTNELPGVEHHSASVRIHELDDGDRDGEQDGDREGGCRLEWITDVLPDAFAEPVGDMMRDGIEAVRRTLEGVPAGR